jgi:hypothetical protein
MHPFFESAIEPLLDAAGARVVVEVGAERGRTTRLLLGWAARSGATVHSIDPAPSFDTARWELEVGGRLRVHVARSLDVLGSIADVDAALLDGDHNWYTVHSELRLLASRAARDGRPLPLVIAHDVGWPYGRRDMYYDPAAIPDEHRHEAARAPIAPGRSRLGEPGINGRLWNATSEGGPRNGVLTAIEDFVREADDRCELVVIDGMHGLGVLASAPRLDASPALRQELKRLGSPEFLRERLAAIETARVGAEMRAGAQRRAREAAARKVEELERGLLGGAGDGGP